MKVSSEKHQPIVDWMTAECAFRHIPYFCFYSERFPQNVAVTIRPDKSYLEGNLYLAEYKTLLQNITGIWYYHAGQSSLPRDLDPSYAQMVFHQTEETMKGLYLALKDKRWINPPHRERVAWHKSYQLRLAAQIGLKTPRTVITNDPQEAFAFLDDLGGQAVYKPITSLKLTDTNGNLTHLAYATLITKFDIEAQFDSIHVAPCMFQEYISPQYDLTVYVIGKYVWATAIHSQKTTEEHQLDYRKNGMWDLPYVPTLLPYKVEQMLLDMTCQMGLRMCNFDMLYTKEGEYIFLEANPTDLWAKVEDLTGFPLCTAIVDELVGVDTLASHPYIKDRSIHFRPNTTIKKLAA